MNLYLLTQHTNGGYDTYDSCVVAATSEEEARQMRPSGETYTEFISCPYNKGREWDWAHPDAVTVTLLGIATPGTSSQVICASFNAG